MDIIELDQLVEDFQALLSRGELENAIAAIPEEWQGTVQCRYLQAVAYYSGQHKAEAPDWRGAYERFLVLQDDPNITPLLAFHIPNHLLLSLRNAGGGAEELQPFFQRSVTAAGVLEGPIQDQLLGFTYYNWARFLHKVKRVDDALPFYNRAGEHRVRFYQHLKAAGSDEAAIKAAATQVWKIRHDWPGFFPSRDVSECSVSEEMYDQVAPLANPAFSAKPK